MVTMVLGLLVASCRPAPTPAPPTPTPVAVAPTPTPTPVPKVLKVGLLGPHTGPSARVGEEFRDAATMAFDAIDWKIGPYKIELVYIDSESDPEKATRAYEEAILRDKIECGLINWHSSVSVAVMEVAAKHKVPHFFAFGATEVVNEKYLSDPEKYSYWVGKWWPVPEKLSIAYVETLEEAIERGIWTPKEKKFAIFGEDTDWGRSFGAAIRAQLEKAGWEMVADTWFAADETEFYPVLKRMKDAGVVLLAGTTTFPHAGSALIKQAREIGLKSLIISDGLGWIGEWYKLTGDASDYVLDQIPQWTTDEAKEFAKEFEERWGITPSPSAAGLAYDNANFFIKVCERTLEKYGELNSETLYKVAVEEVETGKLTYTDGIIMEEYKFTPETMPDPVVGKGYYIFPVIQYFGGKGRIIWPEEWKEADLEIPPSMK